MPHILKLHVSLRHSNPIIWRRLQVSDDYTLEQFHFVLQAIFEWDNSYPHLFDIKGRQYESHGEPDAEGLDERQYTLSALHLKPGDEFLYNYDPADSWDHIIVVETVETGVTIPPRLLEGEGAAPPEDIGGMPGYEALLQVLSNPAHPDYEEAMEWLGYEPDMIFDPNFFSDAEIDAINDQLRILHQAENVEDFLTGLIPYSLELDGGSYTHEPLLETEEIVNIVGGPEPIADQNRQLWLDLYTTTKAMRKLQPWQLLTDRQLVAIESPHSPHTYYASVTGAPGEVSGFIFFEGERGFSSYAYMLEYMEDLMDHPGDQMLLGLLQSGFKVEFTDRELLTDEEAEQTRALGLSFRGPGQWLRFERLDRGAYPWYLTDEEAVILLDLMQQLRQVLKRVQTAEIQLNSILPTEAPQPLLVRRYTPTGEYVDDWVNPPIPVPLSLLPNVPGDKVEAFRKLERRAETFYVSMVPVPLPLQEVPGETPVFTLLILFFDDAGNPLLTDPIVLGMQVERIAGLMLEFTRAAFNYLPTSWVFSSDIAHGLLSPFLKALDLEVRIDPQHPAFARAQMLELMLLNANEETDSKGIFFDLWGVNDDEDDR